MMKVLLIDDEPLLVSSFRRLLTRLGAQVSSAGDGLQGLELLAEGTFDLVLCDVRMPNLDGPGMLERMRARGDQTPLVFLTGYADAGDVSLLAQGAQAVHSKPMEFEELQAILNTWARGSV